MKKFITAAASLLLAVSLAHADFTNTPSFHMYDYVLVTNDFGSAGDTGLTLGRAYICMAVTNTPYLTEALAHETTGNYKQIILGVVKRFSDRLDALGSSDKPTKLTATEQVRTSSSSAADLKFSHTFDTDFVIDTKTVDAE